MKDLSEYDGFDPDETWVNYGDANPEPHGGRFVKYDPEEGVWHMLETISMADIDPTADDDTPLHHVEKYLIEPQDIWVNGNPENGYTDGMRGILEALHEYGGLPGDSPDPESYAFMSDVTYYVAGLTRNVHGTRTATESAEEYDGGYDGLIAEYGVESYE